MQKYFEVTKKLLLSWFQYIENITFIYNLEKRDKCSISNEAHFTGNLANINVGKNTRINAYCQLRFKKGTINIGKNTLIAQNVSIIAHTYKYMDKNKLIIEQGMMVNNVFIGDDVWIGAYAIIMPGIKIGTGAVVGAHSVVTKDISDYEIWVGTPARKLKNRI